MGISCPVTGQKLIPEPSTHSENGSGDPSGEVGRPTLPKGTKLITFPVGPNVPPVQNVNPQDGSIPNGGAPTPRYHTSFSHVYK